MILVIASAPSSGAQGPVSDVTGGDVAPVAKVQRAAAGAAAAPSAQMPRQIRLVAAAPSGVTLPADIDAGIQTEVTAVQDFVRRDVNLALRFQSGVKRATLPARGDFEEVTKSLLEQGFNDPETIYVVFADLVPTEGSCGTSGLRSGVNFSIVWMPACPYAYPASTAHAFPDYSSYLVLHETLHSLGAAPACAPHETNGGHVNDSRSDMLWTGGARDWDNLTIDYGRDDYFGHGRTDCTDIAKNSAWIPKARCSTGPWCAAAPPTTITNPTPVSARQSSTLYGADASRAIDGNKNGLFSNGSVTHTNLENRPWWEMELSDTMSINHVGVWNRTDCCRDRLSDFWVLLSEKPFASNDLDTLLADPNVTAQRMTRTPRQSLPVVFGGVQAKYVRVQLDGTGYLSLAEVTAFDGSNWDRPVVTQSSTASGGIAQRAYDGNYDGDFRNGSVSSTSWENQPWWQVELPESHANYPAVDGIRISNRTDCCSDRLSDFWVLVSDKPFASDDLDTLLADPDVKAKRVTTAPSRSVYVDVEDNAYRYVRVQLAGRGSLSLAEVELVRWTT